MKLSSTSLTHTHMEIKYTRTGRKHSLASSFSCSLFHFFTTPLPPFLLSPFLMQIIFQFPRWCARDKMAARNDDPMQISGPTFFFFLFVLYFFLPNLSRLLNPPHHHPLRKVCSFLLLPQFLFGLSLWKMQTHSGAIRSVASLRQGFPLVEAGTTLFMGDVGGGGLLESISPPAYCERIKNRR